jgi:phosphohistidine phosphatase
MSKNTACLYFMRHADAGDPAEFPGIDADRPLSEIGVRRTRRTATHLAAGAVRPDLVLTSPYLRAVETARILADGLGVPDAVRIEPALAPGFDIVALKGLLAEFGGTGRIVLVGHEPGFSRVIGALIGGGLVEMKKGAIARIDVFDQETPCGELKWLVTPTVLLG